MSFIATVEKLNADSKVNYAMIHKTFENAIALSGASASASAATPLGNPLHVKGDTGYILAVYLTQLKHYVFQLTTIHDTPSNFEARAAYLQKIREFARVIPDSIMGVLNESAPKIAK